MTNEDNEGVFRVNIIAAPPDGTADAANELVDEMTRTLQGSGIPLLTAATVVDVDLRIREALARPERSGRPLAVQILGHATSGQLFLGSSWMTQPDGTTPPEVFRAPYYALTPNPSALGFLYKHAGKLARLDLVGCNVGAAWNDGGYAFSGRTLTYMLCELLRTDVTGAVDLVAPIELSSGVYTASGSPSEGWSYHADDTPSRIGPRKLTGDQLDGTVSTKLGSSAPHYSYSQEKRQFQITQIVNAHLPVQDPTFPKQTKITVDAVPLKLEPRLRLASKELLLTITDGSGGEPSVAAMFGNGRFLAADTMVYAVQNGAQVSQSIGALLWG